MIFLFSALCCLLSVFVGVGVGHERDDVSYWVLLLMSICLILFVFVLFCQSGKVWSKEGSYDKFSLRRVGWFVFVGKKFEGGGLVVFFRFFVFFGL